MTLCRVEPQEADPGDLALLRTGSERPCSRRTERAEKFTSPQLSDPRDHNSKNIAPWTGPEQDMFVGVMTNVRIGSMLLIKSTISRAMLKFGFLLVVCLPLPLERTGS